MFKRIKNWIIDKWERFKKWFIGLFLIATVLAAAGTTIKRTVEIDEPRLSEPSGLVLHLDQSDPRSYGDAGNWYDLSGYGNHGTQETAANQPSITGSDNLAGYTREFDGGNDYVEITDNSNLNYSTWTEATFSFWARPDVSTSVPYNEMTVFSQYGVSGDRPIYFHVDHPSDKWDCKINNGVGGDVIDISVIVPGEWYHVTAVWISSTSLKLYIDGVLVNTDTTDIAANMETCSNPHWIGARSGYEDEYFNGAVDSVRVYNRALSAAEIQRQYMATAPKHGGF